ncbi:MAG: hypothetical protein J6P84_03595 [Alphaproteobacteria bacterium]|nr:hypothetical protein [Clostridia bacterium]MBO6056038.1 hypothetical protein [Alphaproteobacteria bacterium]
MKNVKIYSMSLNKETISKIDYIVNECNNLGFLVTRSHVINTLIDSCSSEKQCVAWINFFRAENEYNQQIKRMRKGRKDNV